MNLTHWRFDHGEPVLAPGDGWDRGLVLTPTVIRHDGAFHMWYTGGVSLFDFSTIAIGYATSADGITWTRRDQPVLAGRDGEWDDQGVGMPSVLFHDGFLHMWYGGGGGNPDTWDIGYARSENGLSWERFAEPVMTRGAAGEWNAEVLGPGTVIFEDDAFTMWFFAGIGSVAPGTANTRTGVGYATSSDGRRWTVRSDPVLSVDAGAWDANYVITPNVIRRNDGYHLFYSGWRDGGSQEIGYAHSPDGIAWTKRPEPVLGPPSWAGEAISPSVIVEDGRALMWFQGWQGASGAIGRAIATD